MIQAYFYRYQHRFTLIDLVSNALEMPFTIINSYLCFYQKTAYNVEVIYVLM